MTLEEEIADWARPRPAWQRDVLRRLASGETLGPDDFRGIADALVRKDDSGFSDLATTDVPGSAAPQHRVRLAALRGVDHVNALVPAQEVTFALDGLTVIYGDNGSGKSGYARLVKRMVRSRHREEVLTDIFADEKDLPAAQVELDVDGIAQSHAWPATGSAELRSMTFFDEACGDAYISHESEVTFRPAAIFVLDGLIEACDGVRVELDKLLSDNTTRARRLPEVEVGTAAAALLGSLSGKTTTEQIDEACATPADIDDQVQSLSEEELRLRATDPTRERSRLQSVAGKYDRIRRHFETLESVYGAANLTDLAMKQQTAANLRAAAQIASSNSFDSEPVAGVGSQTWRTLWEAARTYSESVVDHEHAFPLVAPGSRCVLCQQPLDDDARARFTRFEASVRDQTARQADEAEQQLRVARQAVEVAIVEPQDILVVLDDLAETDAELVQSCRDALTEYAVVRSAAVQPPSHGEAIPSTLTHHPVPPLAHLEQRSTETLAVAASLDADQFRHQLQQTTTRRADLESRRTLHAAQEDLRAEVARRADRTALDEIKRSTDTTGITRKSTELTRAHVTSIIRDRFTRESDRLRLERVTIEDTGGQKGQLRQRPAFVGAVQHPSMEDVLSEGEQTALGLAGFFTEAYLDGTRSAVILDDPVCSLDHVRRGHVANRLTELAKERQVIVFTHDLAFVVELRIAADRETVEFAERTVERRGDGRPGVCVDGHPWKTKDIRARLGQLEAELARIKGAAAASTGADYDRDASDWAGKLSETWERMIRLEVVGRVSDLATLEVHPKMFRMFVSITAEDNKQLQESYERCSRWARRHDKSPALNYVAPTTDEMAEELGNIRTWYDRVRKYASN